MQEKLPASPPDLRKEARNEVDFAVEVIWKSEAGEKIFESCRAIDLSETGVAIECPESIPVLAHVTVRAPLFEIAALAQVKRCIRRKTAYLLGLSFVAKTSTLANDPMAPDHYEILRLSTGSDNDTIDRAYRTLAKRFHPDNEKSGDAETFLRVAEAHRVLTDPRQRKRYDAERDTSKTVMRFDLRSRDFFAGLRGEQNRRLAVLCLLYRKRSSDHEFPGLSILDLENLSGFTREELGFALWYLCEKTWVSINDRTEYGILASGVDFIEARLADGHAELNLIAAVQIPNRSSGPKPLLHL
jgi:curved DNA-binding protein